MPTANQYILLPVREWKRLGKEVNTSKDDDDEKLILPSPFAYKKPPRPKEKPDNEMRRPTDEIPSLVEKSDLILRRKKSLPIELRRAMFLSDVFTERANQLEFTQVLRKIEDDKKKQQKVQIRHQAHDYLAAKREHKLKATKTKQIAGRTMKEELQKREKLKQESHEFEIKMEKEELFKISDELRKIRKETEAEELKKKADLRKMFTDDLQEKRDYRERHPDTGKCENKCVLASPNSKRKIRFKAKMNVLDAASSTNLTKKAVTIPAILSLPITKKTYIEIKRELYEKKLKEERMRIHDDHMKEYVIRKVRENNRKKIEYEQRLQNVNVTKALEERKARKRIEKIKEYRKIWNKQCAEKRWQHEKERLEDKERLQKLQKKLQNEDEEFSSDINKILREFDERGKNTLPIIKYLKEFEKTRVPKPKQLPEQSNDENTKPDEIQFDIAGDRPFNQRNNLKKN